MTLSTLSLADIGAAAREAFALLAAYPLRWIGITLLFLLCVEPLAFIPYVGFAVKLAVATILSAQMLRLARQSAIGEPPSLQTLWAAHRMPLAKMAILTLAAWFMLACAMVWLGLIAGASSVQFFFGNLLTAAPLSTGLFFQVKVVMYLVATTLLFLSPILVLTPTPAGDALPLALKAAAGNLPLLLVWMLINIGAELAMLYLASLGVMGAAVSIALTVPVLMWGFAFSYTTTYRVLASPHKTPTNVP